MKKSTRKISRRRPNPDASLRQQLVALLKGGNAHVGLADALADIPSRKRGAYAKGLPHTAWQLLEHLRIAQWDILEFSGNATHISPDFPEGYWPKTPSPPSDSAWLKSVKSLRNDLATLIRMVANPKNNLHAPFPWGSGQTLLREALLVADHNAYHVAQLVDLRRALGIWPES
jgi:hypothetical protein